MNGTYNQRIYRKSGLRVPARGSLVSLSLFHPFFFFVTLQQRVPSHVNEKRGIGGGRAQLRRKGRQVDTADVANS